MLQPHRILLVMPFCLAFCVVSGGQVFCAGPARHYAIGTAKAGGAMVWYGWPGPFAPGLEDKIVAEVRRQLAETDQAETSTPVRP